MLLLLPLGLAVAGAAAPAIAGSWDCVATDEHGTKTLWIVDVKEVNGKLTAQLRSKTEDYTFDLLNPKLEGARFSFQFQVNANEIVSVTANLDGERFEGRFTGKDSGSGTITGTRIMDLSGAWSGEWETSPDGGPGPHYMVLKQAGEKVTGTAGPSPAQQLAITNGKFVDNRLTFDIGIPNGASIRFDFKVDGEVLRGDAVLKMDGSEQKFKLAAKRAGV